MNFTQFKSIDRQLKHAVAIAIIGTLLTSTCGFANTNIIQIKRFRGISIAQIDPVAVRYFDAGTSKYQTGNYRGALLDWNQAIAIDPKFALAYHHRAVLKDTQFQDYLGASIDYDRAIAIDPKFGLAYRNRAVLKDTRLKDYPGALADCDRAIAIDPQLALAYHSRAIIKDARFKDYQGALADYNRAISINPQYAEAYFNRGNLKRIQLKDRAGAIADLHQAAQYYRAQQNIQYFKDALDILDRLSTTGDRKITVATPTTNRLTVTTKLPVTARIIDTDRIYSTINRDTCITFPNDEIKLLAGVDRWQDYDPQTGDRGAIVHITIHCRTKLKVYILKVGNYYVPIAERGVKIDNQ
jgi:Tfp pilus assembly protein PilF